MFFLGMYMQAIIRLLLDVGAKPMLKDAFGGTAMLEAVKSGKEDIIKLLLAYGAK